MSYDEPAPYNMIGVTTTLPGKGRSRKQNPIGFIWPKKSLSRGGGKTPRKRRAA